MQITVKDRESLNGEVTLRSDPFDLSDIPMFTATLLVYAIGGTSPEISIQLETSDNLEDWTGVGSAITANSLDMSLTCFVATTHPWGRYVRAMIQLSGTSPNVVYSFWVNTFPSS